MCPTVDVFVLGREADIPAELTDSRWSVPLRIIPVGSSTLVDFAKSPLASQLVDGQSELVALVVGADRELLREVAVFAYDLNPESVAELTIEQVDANSILDPTPATLGMQILLAPRAKHGPVVFRRSKLRQIGPLRPVAEPVWDWVIRATRAGEQIASRSRPERYRSCDCLLPLLVPKQPGPESNWLREHLANFTLSEFGAAAAPKVDEIAMRAGFFQWHDFLEEGHELSQSIEGDGAYQLGDYWHAIMHRREPDYSNAKYWFRRIGYQPIWRDLSIDADGILARCSAPDAPRWRERLLPDSKWDPFAFVDLCEECAADEKTDLALAARRIQYAEMCMLVATALR
jgi:hypothetical protein